MSPVRPRRRLQSSMAPTGCSTILFRASHTPQAQCAPTMPPASASPSMPRSPNSSETTDMDINGVRLGAESAFPKAEYDGRVARARRLLAQAGIDVMVVTGPENIFYLTGQQTPGYYTFQALV